jgi:hypothetical protein
LAKIESVGLHDAIFSRIQPFTVRETKDSAGIDLPEKRIENVPVQLEEAQQLQLYERASGNLFLQIS